jgi:hypothetical protein
MGEIPIFSSEQVGMLPDNKDPTARVKPGSSING